MIRLISNERGDTPLVEAYRTLRSNLQYVININIRSFVSPLLLVEKEPLR